MSTALDVDEATHLVYEEATANATNSDNTGSFPSSALRVMKGTGLLGLVVPTKYGGLGGTLADASAVVLRLGRADASVAMIFGMHCQQIMTLLEYGREDLQASILPEIAEGGAYVASVTTISPNDRKAEGCGPDSVRIDRTAPIVTGGQYADSYLVVVDCEDRHGRAQDLVFARRSELEVATVGTWQAMGMRGTESVAMRLRGNVPRDQIVGEHGEFESIMAEYFGPVGHVMWVSSWLGTAAGALSRVVRHVRNVGAPRFDPSSELLKKRLAEVRGRLEIVNAVLTQALRLLERNGRVSSTPARTLMNTLKTRSAVECFLAVDELIELVGLRDGYLTDSDLRLERCFRDLRSASLNFSNDRLLLGNGALTLMDTEVELVR